MLSEDLKSDLLLNSTLQGFMYELYYRFDSFFTPLSIGLITSRHYLLEQNIAGTKRMEQMEMRKQPATPSKYAGL